MFKNNQNLLAYFLLTTSALMWAGNFVIGRALHGEMTPLIFTFFRWTVVVIVLAPWIKTHIFDQLNTLKPHIGWLTLMAIVGVVLFHTCAYSGLRYTEALNASMITSLSPIVIVVFSYILFKDVISHAQIIGLIVSLIGALIIITKGKFENLYSLNFNIGDLFILGAVTLWAYYSVMLRNKPNHISGIQLLLATALIGWCVLLFASLLEYSLGGFINVTVVMVSAIFYVGIMASIVAYLCWNKGIAIIGATKGGLFLHMMPVFTALMAISLLNEQPRWFHLWGAICVITGIYLTNFSRYVRNQP